MDGIASEAESKQKLRRDQTEPLQRKNRVSVGHEKRLVKVEH
ncbi:hypothetical protein HMPREF1981_00771 [Bacteroides pyogenes F0041]|uniref:Uncharacterized protein n=1 Tax=Bacteroides pyogenes F0041 TaxID=1321819 RepID=U2C8D6_9BACE|nr:hypothetical protein HMPREF1981_00771 [Bacteroides pyogenes F0041]